MWQKIKQEWIKTFVRGDKIPADSSFITWRDYDPSRCQLCWQKIKLMLNENSTAIQTMAAVVAAVVAVITLFR